MTAATEYAIQYGDGDMWEWSCGCPRQFGSLSTALAYLADVIQDGQRYDDDSQAKAIVVKREVSDWEPAEKPLKGATP